MTTQLPQNEIKELALLTDLHLDRADNEAKNRLWDMLAGIRYDAALITGDISVAALLQNHLALISRACWPRPVYFLLGNHDYFGSSLARVNLLVEATCKRHLNLIPVGLGEIVRLTRSTAIVAHAGWYDGQAGSGARTCIDTPDRLRIDDFQSLSRREFFAKLRNFGHESAKYFRLVLPSVLRKFDTVLIATHVPPFWQGVLHGGGPCDWNHQPYFSNMAAGNVIASIARYFPRRRVIVHAGHTHCQAHARLSANLEIRVAGSQPGFPTINCVMQVD